MKSAPIVPFVSVAKDLWTKRLINDVFPTDISPIRMTLNINLLRTVSSIFFLFIGKVNLGWGNNIDQTISIIGGIDQDL